MTIRNKILSIFALLTILFSALALPSRVFAAFQVFFVEPNPIFNNADTVIRVKGEGFIDGAKVRLDGTELATTFKTDTLLEATVPAGKPAGNYVVQVVNGDSTVVTMDTWLQIISPTPIPSPTATTAPFGRPQIVLKTYRTNVGSIAYGTDFNLVVRLGNAGQYKAVNVQAAFASSDLTAIQTGGVVVFGEINADGAVDVAQKMRVNAPLYGKTSIPVDMTVTYYDEKGTQYTEKFTLDLPVVSSNYTYSTPTPTSVKSSQLVITAYTTSVEPLQPGVQFNLDVTVQNMGNATAQRVVMILGGGTTGGGSSGTPEAGGVSAGSGQFDKFAPIGASNIQSLGNLSAGDSLKASQALIVNVSTDPGAYPMPITFSYLDGAGNVVNDQQVITLLVYNLPNVDVNFYTQPGPLYAGQPNPLPLQVLNLGRRATVLGNMQVSSAGGYVENGTLLVGNLEPGGYTTLDAMISPDMPGSVDLNITIDYTDDFGKPRQITQTLTLEVMDAAPMPTPDPNMPTDGSGEVIPADETFWQKAWRFILGLFGLDSGMQQPPIQPGEPVDPNAPGVPIPVPAGGGGKG